MVNLLQNGESLNETLADRILAGVADEVTSILFHLLVLFQAGVFHVLRCSEIFRA